MTQGLNIKRKKIKQPNQYDPTFLGMTIDPTIFNALLAQYGVKLLHEKAYPCPNYVGDIGLQQHDPDCTICENLMVHYDGKELIGYFSTNDMVRNYLSGGFWEKGTAHLTVPSYYVGNPDDQVYVSFFDRFTLLDFEDRFYEVLHKSRTNVDKLHFKALKVEQLRTATTIYEQGRDFIINQAGNIEWLNNNRPAQNLLTGKGEIFSVSYLHRPVYRVLTMLHEGRFTQLSYTSPDRIPVRMPQQMIIKKDYLVDKTESGGAPNPTSNPVLP